MFFEQVSLIANANTNAISKDHIIKMPYSLKIRADHIRPWGRDAEHRRQVAPHR